MFERNKVDTVDHNGVPVEITTDGDEILTGRLLVAMGRSLTDVLNGAGVFLEFEPYGGDRIYIAKATIRDIKPKHVPKAQSLKNRLGMLDGFDPHGILGVPSEATFDEIKSGWHRLAKVYHPDRYASAELPPEVVDYLDAMARRINAAYAALEATLQAPRRAAVQRSQPIYTSRVRA